MRMTRFIGALLLSLLILALGCDFDSSALEDDRAGSIEDATIYEMFIPDFSEEGTFQGAIDRFDHLEALGINTIWLMPIHPIGEERSKGELGSPYSIRDFRAVNPNYGTEEDFQAFVDAANDRGMRVIMDLVANHTAWDHAWTDEHPEWYVDGPVDGFSIPVMDGDTTDWTDVVQLDYDQPELREEMIDMMQYWVEEFGVDGYRADVAALVPYDFWSDGIDSLEAVQDPVFMLAEADEPEMHEVGFDLTYAWPSYSQLVATWTEGAPVSEYTQMVETVQEELPDGALRMRFTTNHDETAWDAPPPVLFDGHSGSEAAFVLANAMPGVPLIYNGQELGVDEPIPFFEATPYDWDADATMMDFYTSFMSLYTQSTALRHGDMDVLTPDAEDAVLIRRTTEHDDLIIAVNVRDREVEIAIPEGAQPHTWTEVFPGFGATEFNAPDAPATLQLDAYEYRMFIPEG